MNITNLSQLESEALMKDLMSTIKGGGDPSRYDKCASCVCPKTGIDLEQDTYEAARDSVIGPDI